MNQQASHDEACSFCMDKKVDNHRLGFDNRMYMLDRK